MKMQTHTSPYSYFVMFPSYQFYQFISEVCAQLSSQSFEYICRHFNTALFSLTVRMSTQCSSYSCVSTLLLQCVQVHTSLPVGLCAHVDAFPQLLYVHMTAVFHLHTLINAVFQLCTPVNTWVSDICVHVNTIAQIYTHVTTSPTTVHIINTVSPVLSTRQLSLTTWPDSHIRSRDTSSLQDHTSCTAATISGKLREREIKAPKLDSRGHSCVLKRT